MTPDNCERFELDLSLLAAEALPAEDEPALRQHLAQCPACRERLSQLTAVGNLLARGQSTFPAFDAQRMADRVQAQTQPSVRVAPNFWERWEVIAATACLGVVSLLSTWAMLHFVQPLVVPVPPPAATAVASQPPTLLEYQSAAADSDEALDRLLDQESARLTFISIHHSPLTAKDFAP